MKPDKPGVYFDLMKRWAKEAGCEHYLVSESDEGRTVWDIMHGTDRSIFRLYRTELTLDDWRDQFRQWLDYLHEEPLK